MNLWAPYPSLPTSIITATFSDRERGHIINRLEAFFEICWFGLVGSPSPLHSLRNSIPRFCPLLRVNYAIFQWCLLARGGRCIPVQANKSKFDAPRISNLSLWFGYEPCIRVDLSRAWIFEIIASISVHCYHDDVVWPWSTHRHLIFLYIIQSHGNMRRKNWVPSRLQWATLRHCQCRFPLE